MRGLIVVLVGVLVVSACDIEKSSGPSAGASVAPATEEPKVQPPSEAEGRPLLAKRFARWRCC